jgi:hypothetical protein
MRDAPNHAGSFDSNKHWKKLRDKHERVKKGEQWKPERYRPSTDLMAEGQTRIVSDELYDLNYDLAFGRITEEEYNKKVSELEMDS